MNHKMNIDAALNWLDRKRPKELVKLGYEATKTSAKEFYATFSGTQGFLATQGTNVQLNHIRVIFERQALITENIKLNPGLRMWRGSQVYDLVPLGKDKYELNDPRGKHIILFFALQSGVV